MKNNLVKQTILKAIGKVAEVEANLVFSEWPPACSGFIHQPKRPQKKGNTQE